MWGKLDAMGIAHGYFLKQINLDLIQNLRGRALGARKERFGGTYAKPKPKHQNETVLLCHSDVPLAISLDRLM